MRVSRVSTGLLAGVGRYVQGESLKTVGTSLACSQPPAAGPLPARP